MLMYKHRTARAKEAGMASFVVVFMLMIIISLVTLSFAKIIRREQTQVLDRQLSSRAYYAAESGVNLAQSKMSSIPSAGKTNCIGNSEGISDADYLIDASSNTEVTCLKINKSPGSYQTDLTNMVSKVFKLTPATTMDRLLFAWSYKGGTAPGGICSSGSFPTKDNWGCAAPLLRVDIVPASNGGNLSTYFLYPTGIAAGSISVGQPLGTLVNSGCVSGKCTSSITGLSNEPYYIRAVAIYGDATLEVTPFSGGLTTSFRDTQAVIDSTGRAQDVVRRIQVRVPLEPTPGTNIPFGGLQAGGEICKLLTVTPGQGSEDGCLAP